MTTIEYLNQTSSSELRQLLERNAIKIKKETQKLFEVFCPNCDEDEAYIYFNQGSRNIECNRKNGCGYKKGVWEYIKERKGFSTNEAMLQYVNEELGYEFKHHNSTKTKILKPKTISSALIRTEKPLEQQINETNNISVYTKTDEEILEERKFFQACHLIFTECLYDPNNKQAAFSLNYLKEVRKYHEDQIKYFNVGFFPNEKQFIQLLINNGYSHEEVKTLIFRYFKSVININNYYKATEENKNRITLPWFDIDNNIVGFTVRKPTSQKLEPKYLNHDNFTKAHYLFNFTKDAIGKDLVIVEGQLDALVATYFALRQEETKHYHFIAIGNSCLGDNQIACLKNHGYSKVILLPDQDPAGVKGTPKSIDKLIKQGITPYLTSIPNITEKKIKDIDELFREHQSEVDLKDILEKAVEQVATKKDKDEIDMNNNLKEIRMNSKQSPELDPEVEALDKEKLEIQKLCKEQTSFLKPIDDSLIKEFIQKLKKLEAEIQKNIIKAQANGENPSENDIQNELSKTQGWLESIKKYNKHITKTDPSYEIWQDVKSRTDNDILNFEFKGLEDIITIRPGTIGVIAGRPGEGKTTFLTNLYRRILSANPNKSFIFYTLEESIPDIANTLVLQYLRKNTPYDAPVSGKPLEILEKHISEMPELSSYDLYNEFLTLSRDKFIDDEKGRINASIHSISTEIKNNILILADQPHDIDKLKDDIILHCVNATIPVGAIFIDYIQLLNSVKNFPSRQQELQYVCQILLEISKQENIAIIVGAQFNRNVKNQDSNDKQRSKDNDDNKMSIDKIRECGDIEQYANFILGVTIIEGVISVKCLKNRKGKTTKEFKKLQCEFEYLYIKE